MGQEIQMDMEKFNNDAMCWGVENMMAYRLAQYKAMEECGKYGQFSTLPAPANNPFTTLPGDASNPWMNVPQPVDSRRNPLSKLFNRNSNSDKWTNLWSDFLNGRSKRQPEAVDDGRLAAAQPEEDPGRRGPRVEAEADR